MNRNATHPFRLTPMGQAVAAALESMPAVARGSRRLTAAAAAALALGAGPALAITVSDESGLSAAVGSPSTETSVVIASDISLTSTLTVNAGQMDFTKDIAAAETVTLSGTNGLAAISIATTQPVSIGEYITVLGGAGADGAATAPTSGAEAVSGGLPMALTNSGTLNGGNGGNALLINSGVNGADGGAGVRGLVKLVNNASGSIMGGQGGYGATTDGADSSVAGNGGNGGNGVTAGSGSSINNSGTIEGGKGGDGGANTGSIAGMTGGAGGNGGAGVKGDNIAVINNGTINGGSGGYGGYSGSYSPPGMGGAGISGSHLDITNSGFINGGGCDDSSLTPCLGAAIEAKGNSTIRNSGFINGTVYLTNGGNKLILEADSVTDAVFSDGSGIGDTLTLGGNTNADGGNSFSLSLIGDKYNGFLYYTKEGTSTWTLTDSGDGNWEVKEGTLGLAPEAWLTGNVSIDSGATFAMADTSAVRGNVTNVGTLSVAEGAVATIDGNYTQDGMLSIGASSVSSYGKLNVTGNVILHSGASLNVNVATHNTLANGNVLSAVLKSGSTLSNYAVALPVTDDSALFNFTANVHDNQVDLVTVAAGGGGNSGDSTVLSSVTHHGFTPGIAAAKVLDTFVQGGATGTDMDNVVTALGKLATEQQVSDAVAQTLPLLTGGTTAAATSALSSINKVVQARIDGNRGMSSGDAFFTDRHLWFKPFASWADQDNKSGVRGYKSNLSGAAFGGDAVVSDNNRLGAAMAYASADVKGNDNLQRAKVDVYQLIGYGSHSLDANTELSYQADIGRNINRGRRNVAFMGTTATANYRSTTYHLGAGIGRTYSFSEATSITPSIRADYTHVRDGGYSENGAGALNLSVAAHSTEEMLWSADVKLAHKLKDSLTLVANGGFAYDSMAKASSVTAAYAGAPGMGFTTTGIKPDATTWRGGIGLVSNPENGPEITGRYDVEQRNGYTNQTVSAKARWVF